MLRLVTNDGQRDKQAMAEVAGTLGYEIIKASLFTAMQKDAVARGSKSEYIAGLGMAIEIVAMCESARREMMQQKVKGKDDPEIVES